MTQKKEEKEQSFSAQVKAELSAHSFEKACCGKALCFGIASFAKEFDRRHILIHTERGSFAHYARTAFARQGIHGQLTEYLSHGIAKQEYSAQTEQEIESFLRQGGVPNDERPPEESVRQFLQCPDCLRAFLCGAFLCAGSVFNPEREYHLEFACPRAMGVDALEMLLVADGYEPLRTQKNANYVLYFKASEKIEDLLTYMGAPYSALKIMNEKIYKNCRNHANRVANCETANIDKIVAANQNTIAAVKYLKKQNAYKTLPQSLREAARLRCLHPEDSLADLAGRTNPPISKSGLAHRMKKLEALAEDLRKRQAAQAE